MRTKEYWEKHKEYNKQYYSLNKEKVLARNDKWRVNNIEKVRKATREWRRKNPEKTRSARLKYMYGINLEQYNKILSYQNNVCAICHQISYRNLVVDHCHKTGIVRGLLCDSCNVTLGLMGEDIPSIERILSYLKDKIID
jgi:hypothetical protein